MENHYLYHPLPQVICKQYVSEKNCNLVTNKIHFIIYTNYIENQIKKELTNIQTAYGDFIEDLVSFPTNFETARRSVFLM